MASSVAREFLFRHIYAYALEQRAESALKARRSPEIRRAINGNRMLREARALLM